MDTATIVQTLLTAAVGALSWHVRRAIASANARAAEARALREANNRGTQALLRDRLLSGYREAKERGYVVFGEAQNYANMYKAYHELGKNGVMDNVFQAYSEIPIHKSAGDLE